MGAGVPNPRQELDLFGVSPGELDALFAVGKVLRPGPGSARGTVLIWPGKPGARVLAGLIRLLLWQGKDFDEAGRELSNRITPLRLRYIRAKTYIDVSWLDHRECFVFDYSESSRPVRAIRDELREIDPGTYLGHMFWRNRRLVRFSLAFPGGSQP